MGQACKRYEKMDLSAICQYLANTLKAAQSFDMLVLKALVSDMSVSHQQNKLSHRYPDEAWGVIEAEAVHREEPRGWPLNPTAQ